MSQLFTIHTPVTVELDQLVTATSKSAQGGVASPAHAASAKAAGNRGMLDQGVERGGGGTEGD